MKKKIFFIVMIIILLIVNAMLTAFGTTKATNYSNERNLANVLSSTINIKYNSSYVYTDCARDQYGNVAYKIQENYNGANSGGGLYKVNIEETYNNKDIEKIIRCGYPYKTPLELGVTTENEAKLITQQAIYHFLGEREWENYEVCIESDKYYLDGIKNIIQTANKLQMVETEQIVCTKDWAKDRIDENAISQEYKVCTNSLAGNYTVQLEITEKNNKDVEIFVADLENNPQSTFKINEKFKIVMKNSDETLEGDIKIKVHTQTKELIVQYGKGNGDLKADYLIPETQDKILDLNLDSSFSNISNALHVLVIENDTQAPIDNAKFELTNINTESVTELQSNETGEINLQNIDSGKYNLKQISTNENYTISDTIEEFEMKSNSNIEFTIENNKIDNNTQNKDNSQNILPGDSSGDVSQDQPSESDKDINEDKDENTDADTDTDTDKNTDIDDKNDVDESEKTDEKEDNTQDDDVNNNTSVENEKTEKQENTAKTTSNKKLPKTGM